MLYMSAHREARSNIASAFRFIFIQSVSYDGTSLFQRVAGAKPLELKALDALKQAREFESVQWDVANQALSPHVVGCAVRKEGQQGKAGKKERKAKKRAARA